jgi:hypothetical protein
MKAYMVFFVSLSLAAAAGCKARQEGTSSGKDSAGETGRTAAVYPVDTNLKEKTPLFSGVAMQWAITDASKGFLDYYNREELSQVFVGPGAKAIYDQYMYANNASLGISPSVDAVAALGSYARLSRNETARTTYPRLFEFFSALRTAREPLMAEEDVALGTTLDVEASFALYLLKTPATKINAPEHRSLAADKPLLNAVLIRRITYKGGD